jgi:hypothetical protein
MRNWQIGLWSHSVVVQHRCLTKRGWIVEKPIWFGLKWDKNHDSNCDDLGHTLLNIQVGPN